MMESETQENDIEERIRRNLDLVAKLKKELDNLHLERVLDSSRAKILKNLGIGSWQLLKDKATEDGMSLHDYISLKEEKLTVGVIDMLCTKSFIDPGNVRDLEKEYIHLCVW